MKKDKKPIPVWKLCWPEGDHTPSSWTPPKEKETKE